MVVDIKIYEVYTLVVIFNRSENLIANLELRTYDLLQLLHVRPLNIPQYAMCMKQSSLLFLQALHDFLV